LVIVVAPNSQLWEGHSIPQLILQARLHLTNYCNYLVAGDWWTLVTIGDVEKAAKFLTKMCERNVHQKMDRVAASGELLHRAKLDLTQKFGRQNLVLEPIKSNRDVPKKFVHLAVTVVYKNQLYIIL
ncbi:hypothetical protein MKW98_010957, partial [Papaver atlanticum]